MCGKGGRWLDGWMMWDEWMMWDGWVRVTTTKSAMSFVEIARSPDYFHLTWYTLFIFFLSKIAEFGDTLLIIARGRPLRFIQWYHHLLTFVCLYMGISSDYAGNSAPAFCTMVNASIHTIMYGWYAACVAGFRSPMWLKHFISFIQVVQMFFGCWLVYIVNHNGDWWDNDPVVFCITSGMYVTYVFLFGHMLLTNVCTAAPWYREHMSQKKDV